MVKVKVLTLEGEKSSTLTLPEVFDTPYRPDLIKRAVLSEQSKKRQPQGRFPLAGRQVAATSLGPGRGLSKVPRTHGKKTHHGQRGTLIHSTVGGRLAFPPKVDKVIVERINKKEKKAAIWSAVSATGVKEVVEARGHLYEEELTFPLVIEDKLTEVEKTSEIIAIMDSLGVGDDLARAKVKKVRAGKGKMRGRKYRKKTGPLIVVADECKVQKAAGNIPGVDVCKVKDLSVEILAPGTHAGRLTLWTESAIKQIAEWRY